MGQLSPQHALELVTAPTTTPITAAEAKTQMRVEHSDDDTLIARLVDVAVAFCDAKGALGKAMITQTWAQWLAPNPSTVRLLLGPVQSVTAVKYYNASNVLTTDTLSNYDVLGTSTYTTVKPKTGYTWPTTYNRDDAIKIEYTVGYGDATTDVPQNVRHALMMLVAHWYENRENELIGVSSQTLPFGFEELLGQDRAHWYG